MNSTLLPPRSPSVRRARAAVNAVAFREPAYECRETDQGLRLTVYIPGVEAAGVEIEGHGADLTVHARKPHPVRVNFDSLHLEGVQRDYLLRLRLGHGFDFSAMAAEITRGVLTVNLPKRANSALPRVA
ncbi:MAG: Hsp20/alpha crystallin family protein [Opitutaceae bacterium]